jgi:hypothetical protein
MVASKKDYKIWKSGRDNEAGFMITPETAVMAGSKSAFIAIDKAGTHISGPVSFITTSENIRVGGLFVGMNDFVKMMPSNIVLPIPSQLPIPPVALFTSLALSLPFMMAMLIV